MESAEFPAVPQVSEMPYAEALKLEEDTIQRRSVLQYRVLSSLG